MLSNSPEQEEDHERNVPGELMCQLCEDLMVDAVVIPCCGNSYCDECKYEPITLSLLGPYLDGRI